MTPPAQIDGPEWVLVDRKALIDVYLLIDPPPTTVNGVTHVFVNPHAAEVLTALSARIRKLSETTQAAAPQPKAEGWRPISEAPKTGREILAGYYGEQDSYAVKWHDGSLNHWGKSGWFFVDDDLLTSKPRTFDVFMEFPTPPVTEGADHE